MHFLSFFFSMKLAIKAYVAHILVHQAPVSQPVAKMLLLFHMMQVSPRMCVSWDTPSSHWMQWNTALVAGIELAAVA